LTGYVEVWYCARTIFDPECISEPEMYSEWGQTQVTVYPVVYPSADSVSPSSGSGLSQTFTAQYSSAAGAGDIAELDFWIGGGGATYPCHLRYWSGSQLIGLHHDTGGYWMQAPVGSAGSLQNGRCVLTTGGSSATPSGTQWTLVLPLAFESSWAGSR